jgi:hypothetical protein
MKKSMATKDEKNGVKKKEKNKRGRKSAAYKG